LLISEPDLVDSLNDQPVMDRTESSNRVTHRDISKYNM